MIIANELRIGNFLQADVEICIVGSLDYPDFYAGSITTEKLFNSSKDKIESIPLTEEWLLKMGAKITTGYSETGLKMKTIKTDFFEVHFSNIEIDFVHQLQNLYFALTGEELIVKE